MSHSEKKPLTVAPSVLPISAADFDALVSDTQLTASTVAFALLDVHNVRPSSRAAVLRARLAQLGHPDQPLIGDAGFTIGGHMKGFK